MNKIENQIFNYSLKLLSRRAHSIGEIRRKLAQKGWKDEEIIEKVIRKLMQKGFLDDEKFSEEFVASSLRRKPIGKKLLSKKLMEKQVDSKILKTTLENINEESLIEQAIEKRVRIKGKPKSIEELRKLQNYLINQGFDYELIYEKTRKLFDLPED
jgi:regulatory protein